ncbi:MAG: ribonuclease HII [Deltaproteobacteria bacterium]|nr:ribonuclease HII [Deltaproteobacteria bacterium]
MVDLYAEEKVFYAQGYSTLAGVDEVGRGCIAGPVFAAAVLLPPDLRIPDLNDSKKLKASLREKLSEIILREAISHHIAMVSVEDVDSLNILWASMKAMRIAVEGLKQVPALLLVDGNRETDLPLPQKALVAGDGRCASIAAASVIAKVARDRWMSEQEAHFPGFSFAKHKGYGTAQHLKELREHGPTPLHRRTFAPVQELL